MNYLKKLLVYSFYSLLIMIVWFIISFIKRNFLYHLILQHLNLVNTNIIFTSPYELIDFFIDLAIQIGILIGMVYFISQLFLFFLPAFYILERNKLCKFLWLGVLTSFFIFILYFFYFIPYEISYLIDLYKSTPNIELNLQIKNIFKYVSSSFSTFILLLFYIFIASFSVKLINFYKIFINYRCFWYIVFLISDHGFIYLILYEIYRYLINTHKPISY